MFQISLRAAREICGLSEMRVSDLCGISIDEYTSIELNTELLTSELLKKIKDSININVDRLYIGKELDYINEVKAEFFTPLLPHYFNEHGG